ncbi:hypothetical protein P4O66_021290, partial [Electrophorus voltai]
MLLYTDTECVTVEGNTSRNFLGRHEALEPGLRKTDVPHNDLKEGSLVESSGSLEGMDEARGPSLQWTHQQDWRGLPKALEANRLWGAPRLLEERRTVQGRSTPGTVSDVHPCKAVKAKDTSQHLIATGIPQVIIMSVVDKACPRVHIDLRKIYYSRKNQETLSKTAILFPHMQECSDRLGVPMNLIFPMQNYHEQVTNNLNMDVLLLMTITLP